MTLESLILTLATNLGITWPPLIAFITICGCIIVMAKDLRLGLMILFMLSAVEFMALYTLSQSTQLHLIMILVSFALMAVAYLITYKKTQPPYSVV